MTVQDLLNELKALVSSEGKNVLELEVYSSSDYGDHSHTEALNEIRSVVQIVPGKTAYSPTELKVPSEEEDEEDEQEGKDPVVVLRYI